MKTFIVIVCVLVAITCVAMFVRWSDEDDRRKAAAEYEYREFVDQQREHLDEAATSKRSPG
jgi:hypothetical protein